jgi:hypothetical protein
MRRLRLTRERQERFLKALAETGIVSAAVEIAGTSRTRVYELRKRNPGFAAGWEDAEERAADALEAEAWRRAVDGVQEPLVSGGKLVRDDDGQPIAIRRYSDALMIALLKARRPGRFKDRAVVEHVAIASSVLDRVRRGKPLAVTIDQHPSQQARLDCIGLRFLTARIGCQLISNRVPSLGIDQRRMLSGVKLTLVAFPPYSSQNTGGIKVLDTNAPRPPDPRGHLRTGYQASDFHH